MKSQTKAFLASVMVLALALSSIGGVTYSWFSDTDTGKITIGTGSLDVVSSLEQGNYSTDSTIDLKTVEIGAEKTLYLKNNGSFPASVTASIVMPRYIAYYGIGEVTKPGSTYGGDLALIGGELVEEAEINGENYSYWTNYQNVITFFFKNMIFNDAYNFTDPPSNMRPIVGTHVHVGLDGEDRTGNVKLLSYEYKICEDVIIEPGEEKQFTFKIDINTSGSTNYSTSMLFDFHLRVDAYQANQTYQYETVDTDGGETSVDGSSSLAILHSNSDVTLKINREVLGGVGSVYTTVTRTDQLLTVSIILYDPSHNPIDLSSSDDVMTIWIDKKDGDHFYGTLDVPLKGSSYTISASTGGSP